MVVRIPPMWVRSRRRGDVGGLEVVVDHLRQDVYFAAEEVGVHFVEEITRVEVGDGGVRDVVADPVLQRRRADGTCVVGEVFLQGRDEHVSDASEGGVIDFVQLHPRSRQRPSQRCRRRRRCRSKIPCSQIAERAAATAGRACRCCCCA